MQNNKFYNNSNFFLRNNNENENDNRFQSYFSDPSKNSNNQYLIRQEIYNQLVDYLGDVVMTKLGTKATSDGTFYGLYYCRVGCMLCVENRYLIAIVANDESIPVGTQMYLSNLQWVSFQTRIIEDFDEVNPNNIKIRTQPVKTNKNSLTKCEMQQTENMQDRVRYECSDYYPIIVDIMKKRANKKDIYTRMDGYEEEYLNPKCSLQTLLESYQCVLSLNV
jgi:hypothetical protein